jgi:hypothetical protein
MTSTAMARRQREAGMTAAAARQHAAEAAERLEPLLARVAPGGEPFALRRLQEALGLLLDDARRALEGADDAHREEERDDIDPRERRDRAAAELHRRLVQVRAACDSVYGPGAAVRVLGLRGRTARHPQALRLEARRVVDRLRDAGKPLPVPAGLAPRPDPEAWAAHLDEPLAELEALLRRVHRDRRARESTLVARHHALRRFDRTRSAVTGLLAALYRLADLDEYEERLRPRRGRPRKKGVEAAAGVAEADAAAGVAVSGDGLAAGGASAAAEDGPMAARERQGAAAGGRSSPRESSAAAEDEASSPREPSSAAADGPRAGFEAPAGAVDDPGDAAAASATAAAHPIDASAPPTPVAHEWIGFSEPSTGVADLSADLFEPSATPVPSPPTRVTRRLASTRRRGSSGNQPSRIRAETAPRTDPVRTGAGLNLRIV